MTQLRLKDDLVIAKHKDVFTNSKIVAEILDVEHAKLLRTVDRIVERLDRKQPPGQSVVFKSNSKMKFPQKFIESTFTNKQGRTYKMYLMNEQAYMKLAMHLKGYEKAEQVQDSIIEAFSLMKERLLQQSNSSWLEKRNEGKKVRLKETDTVKDFIEYAKKQGSQHAERYYIHFTKATNKALEIYAHMDSGAPIRDIATLEELGYVEQLENRVIAVLRWGMEEGLPYKFIFQEVKKHINELASILVFKPKLT